VGGAYLSIKEVPNRGHAHHLNPEDQRTAFIQAVRNVG
jgi:hypothetical protein